MYYQPVNTKNRAHGQTNDETKAELDLLSQRTKNPKRIIKTEAKTKIPKGH